MQGLLGIVAGISTLALQNWGRCLIIMLAFTNVIWEVLLHISTRGREISEDASGSPSWFGWLWLLACSAFVLLYLLRPTVKAQFQKQT